MVAYDPLLACDASIWTFCVTNIFLVRTSLRAQQSTLPQWLALSPGRAPAQVDRLSGEAQEATKARQGRAAASGCGGQPKVNIAEFLV